MRNGLHGHPLARRLARLERGMPVDHMAEWPAFLAECFANAEYDGHREAIIAALLGDTPAYDFSTTDDAGQPVECLINWWHRADGGHELQPPIAVWITLDTTPPPMPVDPFEPDRQATADTADGIAGWAEDEE